MNVYLGIPPPKHRGWSGDHAVSFDYFGGQQKWDCIVLTTTAVMFDDLELQWHYILHFTPGQLIYLSAVLLYKRARRTLSRWLS